MNKRPNLFRARRGELERLRAVSRLAATLTHKISQPLTAAIAYLRAAQRLGKALPRKSVTPLAEALDKAVMQVNRAGESVHALSELVAENKPEKALVGLNALVKETLSFVGEEAAKAGVSIRSRLTKDEDSIFADRVQVEYVLASLIRVAIEAMRESPRRKLLVSTTTEAAKTIRVEIQSASNGSTAGESAHWHDLFAGRKGEIGAGLSVAHEIVHAHSGRLHAKVSPDGDVMFICNFPLRRRELKG